MWSVGRADGRRGAECLGGESRRPVAGRRRRLVGINEPSRGAEDGASRVEEGRHRGARERGPVRREEVFARDGHQCVYCGGEFPVEQLSVDHVQPRVKGGDRSGGNLVTACGACNTRKGHRSVAEFLVAEPAARGNFVRLARHVWPRHLRALKEAMRARP